jgi:DNA ligase 1
MTQWPCVPFGLSLFLLGMAPGYVATPFAEMTGPGHVAPTKLDTPGAATGARATEPALALAGVYTPDIDLAGYLVSEKLDGVRGYWDGRRLITRGGLVIQAPAWFTAGFPTIALDGELWMGRGTFAALSGTIRQLEPDQDAWRRIRYMLFDLPDHPGDFEARLSTLTGLVAASPNPFIGLVEQTRVADHHALMSMLDEVVVGGGEGLMLHRADATYRAGRSADRLKVKPYLEAEARVIGHFAGRGKHQGRMGSLLVEEADGTRFRLGTGFSDAERTNPPAIGSVVNFRYHGRTNKGLPRFASFLSEVTRQPGTHARADGSPPDARSSEDARSP